MRRFALLFMLASLASATAQVPRIQHVVVIMEENHGYSSVIGNRAMPYLNSLAANYGLATNYYANTHPSIGNYFMSTTGRIITNNDSFTGVISGSDIVQKWQSYGKSWKVYAQSIPYSGYTGGNYYPYLKRHNPFSYFPEVVNSSEKYRMESTSHFFSDLSNGTLPNYAFIVPDARHDAHDCPSSSSCTDSQKLAAADAYLKSLVVPLLGNAQFKKSGLLIITFDEAATTDNFHGGGHVATVVVSLQGRKKYRSSYFHQHQSLLKTLCAAGGISGCPGAASSASDFREFFY